jgi:hypothetical protein
MNADPSSLQTADLDWSWGAPDLQKHPMCVWYLTTTQSRFIWDENLTWLAASSESCNRSAVDWVLLSSGDQSFKRFSSALNFSFFLQWTCFVITMQHRTLIKCSMAQ